MELEIFSIIGNATDGWYVIGSSSFLLYSPETFGTGSIVVVGTGSIEDYGIKSLSSLLLLLSSDIIIIIMIWWLPNRIVLFIDKTIKIYKSATLWPIFFIVVYVSCSFWIRRIGKKTIKLLNLIIKPLLHLNQIIKFNKFIKTLFYTLN